MGSLSGRRAAFGIIVIVIGGITIFVGGALADLAAGNVSWIDYIGGMMCACGWGIEGAIAGKCLDIAEPDVGITIRFIGENIIWWIIIVPIIALAGIPIFEYAIAVLNPLSILILSFAGITFGYCYVSWYKSFPLIGVGHGQGIANLYGLCALIFLYFFLAQVPA
ncbi:hypothetical protein [Methanococcoides sp. AM1]|uniref:hypothetical protein n=1 Tax=Methanococcoides sp. AM1 TaxID=1201011 RepID=UPI00352AF94E